MKESNRNIVIGLIDNQNIKQENIHYALEETGVIPSSSSWHKFIDQLLLWFGALSLAFSLMFFVAYNWTALGDFAKFALVEGLMVLTIGVYWYLGGEKLSAKATLMVSSILLGVLLALVGQTYQTGADTWELFFYWAVLMLPWAMVGRFSAIWVVWIALINVSIFLYMETFGRLFGFMLHSENSALWVFFAFNTLALMVWELFKSRFEWLNSSWAIRLLGFVSMSAVTGLAQSFIWEEFSSLAIVAWIAWIAIVYYSYRVRTIDLFMLSLAALTFSIVVVSFLIDIISSRSFNVVYFLFIGLVIIGLGAGFSSWLKSIQKEADDA